MKVAFTVVSALIENEQLPVPLHPPAEPVPVHPLKEKEPDGVAVRVKRLPALNVPPQFDVLQLKVGPFGFVLVTEPLPLMVTFSVYVPGVTVYEAVTTFPEMPWVVLMAKNFSVTLP